MCNIYAYERVLYNKLKGQRQKIKSGKNEIEKNNHKEWNDEKKFKWNQR